MGQPKVSQQMEQAQIDTQKQQNQIAQTSQAQAEEDRQRRIALEQPAIDKYTALSTGDRTAALTAAMPVLSQVSQGYQAAKQSILNSVPAGPSRDKALADLEVQKYTTTSGAQAQMVAGAPDTLANIGAGLGATSLQELGAALGANQGAASTAANVQQSADQRKAQNLQLLGGLAGTAGKMVNPITISDRRIKQNVEKVESILDRIAGVDTYAFEYVSTRYDPEGLRHIGVMAQDVQGEFAPAVRTMVKAGQEYLAVDYGAIAALALGAVKELAQRVKELESKLSAVKGV